jgi:steroid 5-alpha reductase family enzyme
MFIAIFIFVVGLVLLLTNLGIVTVSVWDIVWPILIMVFAISMFLHKKCRGHRFCGKNCACDDHKEENK